MRPGFLGTMKGRAGRYNAVLEPAIYEVRARGVKPRGSRNRRDRVQARPEPIGRALRVRAVFLRKIRLLPHPDHIREFSPKGCFVEADQRDLVCPLPFAKIFPFLSKANHFISRAVSLLKGAYRDRHGRGAGCGGR